MSKNIQVKTSQHSYGAVVGEGIFDKQIKEIAHNIRAKYNYQQKRHSNQIDIFNMVGVQNFNFIYT